MSVPDPLTVVARLRRAREQDSLLGLRQARAERDAASTRSRELAARLESPAPLELDAISFADHRRALTALGQESAAAERQATAATGIAETAQAFWQGHRVRLEAIETLIVRRAETRRHELAAAERRELDDIALGSWMRRQGALR